MGIFGDDKLQNERIDALENHLRVLTEAVMANQADLAGAWIGIMSLQAQVDGKISASDVDPTIGQLNDQLKTARQELEKTSAAASESWATLQAGARKSFDTLRESVQEARDRIKED